MNKRPSEPNKYRCPRIDDSMWLAASALALLPAIGFVLYKADYNRNSVIASQETRAPGASVPR
jgi:hypothetical protein